MLPERWPTSSPGRSRTTTWGGFVWTVANATDPAAPFEAQAAESLALLDAHLREAGSSRARLLSLQVLLADIADRTAFDDLWREWIGPDPAHWPQRSCIQSGLAPGLRIELVAVAAASPALLPVETTTPPGTPQPIGPYHHIARVGPWLSIGGTAGFDPATGALAGPDVASQTTRILDSFATMLASVGSDLSHVVHVNVFLRHMHDFEAMNRAYEERMGPHRPARTVIGVADLPRPGMLVTMNLTAVAEP